MRTEWLHREAVGFLWRFCGAAAVLFLLRPWLWALYLSLVVPLANAALSLGDGGARYQTAREILTLVYPGLGLRFTIHDVVYQNLIVAVALFAATSGSWRWRLRWIGIALGVLVITHVVSLYAGAQTVVWDYTESLTGPARGRLAATVDRYFPLSSDWFYSRLFGLWHTWGRPAVALVVWLLAAGHTLRLPGGPHLGPRLGAVDGRSERV